MATTGTPPPTTTPPPATVTPAAALVPSSTAPAYRHVIGDLVTRFYTLSGNPGDTLTLVGMGPILSADLSPTTAISVGVSWVNNVITFSASGAWAGTLQVVTRWG